MDSINLQTYDDAVKTCQQQDNGSSLVSIHYSEEQTFLSNLLFVQKKIADNVWIGAKFINSKYKWIDDDSDLTFTNWFDGSPRNLSGYCVQMNSDIASVGKWVDEPCTRRNLVVCQKMQTWSEARMQQIVLNLLKNPVPIGFVYVQLPNELSPTQIWPWMTWRDISSTFAGVFFRVAGGGAADFGQIQEEASPRLVQVNTAPYANLTAAPQYAPNATIEKGVWSNWIYTGAFSPSLQQYYLQNFLVSNTEVRPRNVAIRIWKRFA